MKLRNSQYYSNETDFKYEWFIEENYSSNSIFANNNVIALPVGHKFWNDANEICESYSAQLPEIYSEQDAHDVTHRISY